jgi:outer membrane protein
MKAAQWQLQYNLISNGLNIILMKTKIFMILGALLATLLATAQTKQWTLQQCVDTALVNNRTVKQQTLTKKNREIAYEQARNNLLPNLNAGIDQNFGFGRTVGENNTYLSSTASSQSTRFGLSSNVTLYNGFKLKNTIEARKADMNASEADLDKIKADITTNVAAGFLQILLNKELLQIAKDQLALTRSKTEQRKALVTAGKMAEGELLELVAQESKEEMSRLRAENTLKLSLLDLAQFLELENFENLDVVTPDNLSEADLKLLSAEDVYQSALTHRPEVKGAEFRLKSSEYEVLTSKADYYPSLGLSTSFGTSYYHDNSVYTFNSFGQQLSDKLNAAISLNLSIPIFNKYAVRNNVRSAELGVKSSKISVDNAKLELKKTIQQAYYNALGAKSRWEAAQLSEVASREAYRFTNQKYEAERATSYELYQAKSNLTQVLSEEVQAKYEYFFRLKLLEYLK